MAEKTWLAVTIEPREGDKITDEHHCAVCNRQIRTIWRATEREFESEYRDALGRCWECASAKLMP